MYSFRQALQSNGKHFLNFGIIFTYNIYRRHFRQSVVNMPFHPFYIHLVLHNLYIRLYYTHRLHTLLTLCFNHYLYFMCILRLHPCTNRLCTFQSHILFHSVLVYQSKSIKCCAQEEYFTWRLTLISDACAQLSSLHYGESKTSYARQSLRQFRYLVMGVLTPFL